MRDASEKPGKETGEDKSTPTVNFADVSGPGDQIGSYKLLSVLGEGGFAVVYLAEQKGQVKRRVALKVIKPGMDTKQVIARFEAERQALALLKHPNIAQVYDAGMTPLGRPYFVMEHVKGLSLTQHCDQEKLGIEERLRLFLQVCEAVQHAHQKAIIHRDIKPSNILVAIEGNRAVPKIIDFGVAKAISQPLTERTLYTEQGQFVGTPEYMSPEQAQTTAQDIDTRSDIYSLGVVLYELLIGALPFDPEELRKGGIDHIRQIICETEPRTPSTRLTTLGQEAKKIAQRRRTEVAGLAKRLHKELEWIPLMAMRKERTRRYRSASELADDIQNYLKGAPLIAGPESTIYLISKFIRRKRGLVAAVAAVLTVLIAGIVVSTIFAIGQNRARVAADNAREEAQLIADFLENDVLGSADKARVGEATVSFVLDYASKSLETELKDKPLIQASLYRKLGDIYNRLGEYNKADQHLLKAIEIYRQHHGDEHIETLEAFHILHMVYGGQGRYYDMERLGKKNLEIAKRVADVQQQMGCMNRLALAYHDLGKYRQAESLFQEAIQLRDSWKKEKGGAGWFIECNLACVYIAQGRYEEAEPLFVKTLESVDITIDHYTVKLANLYREQGRYKKAEPLLDTALKSLRLKRGNEYFGTLECMYGLARLYIDQDHYDQANELLNKAILIARKRMRVDHPLTSRFLNAYAVLLTNEKQYGQAEKLFDEALKGRQSELGDGHPETLETINDLGILHRQQKHYEQAEKLLTEALEKRKAKLGDDHPHTLQSMHELGVLYKEQARYDEAEKYLLEAVEGRHIKLGDTHPHTIESLNTLIALYQSWNKPEKAQEWRAKL